MADRDTLASVHGAAGQYLVIPPFSGAWAQADLQHIGGIYRGLLVGAAALVVMRGNRTWVIFRDKRTGVEFRDKRAAVVFRDKRAEVEGD
jgi:hypothetical protein